MRLGIFVFLRALPGLCSRSPIGRAALPAFLSGLLLFGLLPVAEAYVPPGVCLSPLEQAVLVHGKSQSESLVDQLKEREKDLESLQETEEELLESISEIISGGERDMGLANYLREFSKTDDTANNIKKPTTGSDLAAFVERYIEGRQSGLQSMGSDQGRALLLDETATSRTEGLPACEASAKCHRLPWGADESAFQSNGRINETTFCQTYAMSEYVKKCRRAIDRLERQYTRLQENERDIEEAVDDIWDLETEIEDREADGEDVSGTEGDGLCWECLDELRAMDGPTTGQVLGNLLSVTAGVGLSWFGYQAGKRQARDTNQLRMKQGFEALGTSGPSWAGASLGLPFISNGIYGLANGNSNLGLGCDEGYASGHRAYGPFSHYNYSRGQVYGANPYGPGAFAGGEFGLRFGGGQHGAYGPYSDPFGPGAFGGGRVWPAFWRGATWGLWPL